MTLPVKPYLINHNLSLVKDNNSKLSIERLLHEINGNSGNSFISYALARFTPIKCPHPMEVSNIFSPDFYFTEEMLEDIHVNHTHAYLILQDHLGPHQNHLPWGNIHQQLKKIKLPFVIFSLGTGGTWETTPKEYAQAFSDEARQFFTWLSTNALSIGVRGEYSGLVLKALGIHNYAVVGCPSYFEAGPYRQVTWHEPKSVVGLGLFSMKSLLPQPVTYILQSESSLIRWLAGKGDWSSTKVSLPQEYPGYKTMLTHSVLHDKVKFFIDVPRWKRFIQDHCDIALGTRMHGAILALNAGKPAIISAGDIRAKEMCRLFELPHFPGMCFWETSIPELVDKVDLDRLNRAYPVLYQNFTHWLSRLGVLSYHDQNPADQWPLARFNPGNIDYS